MITHIYSNARYKNKLPWQRYRYTPDTSSIQGSPTNKKKCLEPESNQRHEDFQSSALPTELSGHRQNCLNSGDRIWTYDLRVMSPTSFQTAPPRDIMLYMICFLLRKYSRKRKWMEVDSNHRSNLQQIYSLSPLATREPIHKPMIGLEPITCWLQISCSANWATSAYYLNKNRFHNKWGL